MNQLRRISAIYRRVALFPASNSCGCNLSATTNESLFVPEPVFRLESVEMIRPAARITWATFEDRSALRPVHFPAGKIYTNSNQSYPVLYVLDGWHFPLMAFLQENNISFETHARGHHRERKPPRNGRHDASRPRLYTYQDN